MSRATNGRRVVVTCADADMRQITERCLRHVGYEVVTVVDPDRAVTTMRSVRPHLVITSFPTRTTAGRLLTEAIRADADFDDTPILSLASWLQPEDLAHARSAGVTESVPIPVSLNTLVGAVRRLIGPVAPVPDPPEEGRGLETGGHRTGSRAGGRAADDRSAA